MVFIGGDVVRKSVQIEVSRLGKSGDGRSAADAEKADRQESSEERGLRNHYSPPAESILERRIGEA